MTGAAVAAIDCGTNSTRLLIVSPSGEPLTREMRITRLGERVDATGVLGADAMERTLGVLRDYRAMMDAAQCVERSRAVATSAVRDAANGDVFLRSASDVLGTPAELLPGMEEGRLSFAGATSGLPAAPGDTVVVDIGGGSTEIVMERDGEIHAVSTDVGCVRISERYLRHDVPLPEEVSAAVAAIDTELTRAGDAIPGLALLREGSRLIGLAGTVSTIAALELGLVEYQRERVHHATLTRQMVQHWCATLAGEPAAARAGRAGMVDGRQDVIVGGALREVMDRLGVDACLVSESDILDGIALSLRRPAP